MADGQRPHARYWIYYFISYFNDICLYQKRGRMKKITKKVKRGSVVQTILICAICNTEYLYPEGGDVVLCKECRKESPTVKEF